MSKKHRNREQAPKAAETAQHKAMMELRRSSAASPLRNKAKYDRNDYRKRSQNGDW